MRCSDGSLAPFQGYFALAKSGFVAEVLNFLAPALVYDPRALPQRNVLTRPTPPSCLNGVNKDKCGRDANGVLMPRQRHLGYLFSKSWWGPSFIRYFHSALPCDDPAEPDAVPLWLEPRVSYALSSCIPPILFLFPLHCGVRRILHLEPIRRAP